MRSGAEDTDMLEAEDHRASKRKVVYAEVRRNSVFLKMFPSIVLGSPLLTVGFCFRNLRFRRGCSLSIDVSRMKLLGFC